MNPSEQNIIDLIQRKNLSSGELISLLASHNTLFKKLTCDYLRDKASIDGDVILLAANVLLRDCNDPNPCIRSASLRALSSLPNLGAEAGVSSVTKAMEDSSPHVRRVVPSCCVTLFKDCRESCLEGGLIDLLYKGIRDPDPIVVTNCLLALEEVLIPEGGLVINRNIAMHLSSSLSQFSPCNVVYVLILLKKFIPKKEEDLFSILNGLDAYLQSSSPSVLVAAFQLFVTLTDNFQHLLADLYETVKPAAVKALSQSRPELCVFFLEFLENTPNSFLISFRNEFGCFLPKANDPVYLKSTKLRLLPSIACRENMGLIISEVKHYTSDYQSYREAFRCLCALSAIGDDSERDVMAIMTQVMNNSSDFVAETALETILLIILKSKEDMDVSYDLCQGVNKVIRKLSTQNKNPDLVLRTLQVMCPILDGIQDLLEDLAKHSDGRLAHREDSGLDTQEDSSYGTSGIDSATGHCIWEPKTRCLFLTVCVTAFLHHPGVLQPILSSVFSKAFKDHSQEVVSHAAFLYAALEKGPQVALKLLNVTTLGGISHDAS